METILSDEVGIEFALLGKFRARARYRPVYARMDERMFPVAAQGFAAITLEGSDVSPEAVLGNMPSAAARQAFELLALTLAIRNHARSDADALDLFVDFPSASGTGLRLAVDMLQDLAAGRDQQISVFVSSADTASVELLRHCGIRIGLVARLDDPMLSETIGTVKPDTIRMEGDWLERAAKSDAMAALLGRFVTSCHEVGAQVMVADVDGRAKTLAALGIEADYLAGDALGAALPAGAVMDLSALAVSTLTVPNVVPFARRSRLA